jgi:signal transduction histidine kinase
MLLLERTVIRPLTALTRHTVAIAKQGNLAARLGSKRRDEIGVLGGEIDAMVEKLENSQATLLSSARMAGMSEVATGVIHNVGNALNSVNVSAEVVRRKLENLPTAELERISDEIRVHAADIADFLTDDPRGKKFPAWLTLIAQRMKGEQAVIARETEMLFAGLHHIKTLVKSQQDLAVNSEDWTSIVPAHELELALRLSRVADDGALEITRSVEGPESLHVQRHRLLQILVNLMKNARQAVDEAHCARKRMSLRVSITPDGQCVRFEVSDNGVGLAPERKLAIFEAGFTTKEGGHGFGLHSAANAARDMGGSLSVQSDGPGTGATFVLDLPIKEQCQLAA